MVFQEFTVEEVAKHDSASSCWIVINHVVYDVTSFLQSVRRVHV